MNPLNWFKKIETPDTGEISLEIGKIKTELRKTNVNSIKVEFYLRNSPYYIETLGMMYRSTNFTIVIIENPEELGLILLDDSIYFNKATHAEKIIVREGYPFSLNLDFELTRGNILTPKEQIEVAEQYQKLGVEFVEFQKAHPTVKSYQIPVLLNQIPLKVVRIKLAKQMVGFPDEMDITMKIIYQLFFSKILQKVNKPKIQGAFMLLLVGFLSGTLFMTALFLLTGR